MVNDHVDHNRVENRSRAEESPEEIYREMAEGSDSTTQREAFEREMAERGRSDEAGQVGSHLD